MKNLFRNWGPVLAYLVLTFIESSFSIQVKPGVDKVLHVLEYGMMGFLTTRGFLLTWNLPRGAGVALGAGLATLLGILDEFHQYFVPGRTCSAFDATADLIGALLGATLFVLLGTALYTSHKLYPDAQDKCCG